MFLKSDDMFCKTCESLSKPEITLWRSSIVRWKCGNCCSTKQIDRKFT